AWRAQSLSSCWCPSPLGGKCDVTNPPQHADADVLAAPLAEEIELGASDCQVGEAEPFQRFRQPGLSKPHAPPDAVDLQTEERLDQLIDRRRRPGLRRAGDR